MMYYYIHINPDYIYLILSDVLLCSHYPDYIYLLLRDVLLYLH